MQRAPVAAERESEPRVRREVQEREQRVLVAQPLDLLAQRLLDLEDEFRPLEDLVDGRALGVDGPVGRVRIAGAGAGAALDEDAVAAAGELARAGRRDRDPPLVRLDLGGDADVHQPPTMEPAAQVRHRYFHEYPAGTRGSTEVARRGGVR